FGETATWTGMVAYPSNPNYQMSGLHDTTIYDEYAFMSLSAVEENYFNNIMNSFIWFIAYTSDHRALESKLMNDDYDVRYPYELALENLRSTRAQRLAGILSVSGVLIGFSGIGFYFVIRSSLISRIYEVSVYRALGIKKREIFVSFLIEIFVLTTLSTLVGLIIANMMISRLNQGIISMFGLFEINTFTIILGVILVYLLNVFAGLLPVQRLLAKTPAQILAQYDI
ncbi:MAG: ABC transporter permease, partial [Acholeplasmataceae bacterium]